MAGKITKKFLSGLVGLTATQASKLVKALGKDARVIKSGDMATQDFSESRINLRLGKNRKVGSADVG